MVQIWRRLMTYVLLHSIAMLSSWTWKELLVPQLMQGSIFIEHSIKVLAPFRDASLNMDAEVYGFKRRENILVPEIVTSKPEGLPDPCRYSQEWLLL